MLSKKIIIIILFALNAKVIFAQDSNILLSLNGPTYGIKIKNNFPVGTGDFARAFMLSNQDGTDDFFGLGVYGNIVNGVSSFGYGYIGKSYYNPAMSFVSNGNIGIGTLTPTEKLSVKGNIRAKEVKVETANWPDYVFNDDYKRRSLSELEDFILLNKHLPDMPTAVEAEKDGIELGDMNKKLLKQQEEFVLHLIDKDKEIKCLKRENEEIREKLAQILTILNIKTEK